MPRRDNHPMSQPLFHEPTFGEGRVIPDPSGFEVEHPNDDKIYDEIGKLLTTETVGFEPSRQKPHGLYTMAEAYGGRGHAIAASIHAAGKIVFHSVGDSGASVDGAPYRSELSVADQMTMDCNIADARNRPAFLLHLGDVVYDFGESQYYYDQFYAPFRDYPAPIFALAGNHDSFVLPNTPAGETPLDIFARNFCALSPMITKEAGSLHRTAMTQPGVYFALDAPFVRIICLFSNALEDPGVISSDNGKWPGVPDVQLVFLQAQLEQIKEQKYAGAVLIAVHHPPFSYAAKPKAGGKVGAHGSSTDMLAQIDTICTKAGVYPHAIISGHAHNYQRYTRKIAFHGKTHMVPFIISGSGGHHVNTLVTAKKGIPPNDPPYGTDVTYMDVSPVVKATALTLEKYNDSGYGYLRITVDPQKIAIGFHLAGSSLAQSRFDLVTVDLATHTLTAN